MWILILFLMYGEGGRGNAEYSDGLFTSTAPVLDIYTDTLSTGTDINTKNCAVLKDKDCSNTNTDNRLEGCLRKTPSMKQDAR